MAGLRWNLTGGDFRLLLKPAGQPIGNLFYPEIRLRGVQVEAVAGSTSWSIYSGSLQIMQGARLPFTLRTPQALTGGSVTWKREELLEIQSSLILVSTDTAKLAEQSYLLPEGRTFASSLQGRVNATWRPGKQLRLSSELALSSAQVPQAARPIPTSPLSMTSSAEWNTTRLSLRGSYIRQGAAYMPLAGYFLGDRKGPFAEVRYKAHRRIDLYSSGTITESNVDSNPAVATMQARSGNAGVSLELPMRLNVNAQLSSMDFTTRLPGQTHDVSSRNRQTYLSVSRSFQHHNLRFGYRDLNLRTTPMPARQRSGEVEEMVSFQRWSAGGSVRYDSSYSTARRSSLYFRGNLQAGFRRLSAYAYTELGRDLANQSVFITSQTRSSGAGLSTPLGNKWLLSAEMMRTSLNNALNEQSAFLLAANGAPVSMAFPGMDRWNVLIRVSKTFHWGGAGPQSSLYGRTTDQLYPVMGAIEGFVRESGIDAIPVANVPVQLDNNRTEATDQNGRFRFTDVAQGPHSVQLPPRQLPAEFDPTSSKALTVSVQARRTTRADLSLVRLGSLSGKIVAPSGTPLEDIIIHIAGSRRYTSPDPDGNFTIYNLPQGRYHVTLDAETLPADHRITTAGSVSVTLKSGQPHDVILFGIARVEVIKPVRRINLPPQAAPIARSNPRPAAEPSQANAPLPPAGAKKSAPVRTPIKRNPQSPPLARSNAHTAAEPGPVQAAQAPAPPQPTSPKTSTPAQATSRKRRSSRNVARRIKPNPRPSIARSTPYPGAEPNHAGAPLPPRAQLARTAKPKDPINWRDGHAVADPGRNGQNPGVHPPLPARSLRSPVGVSRQPDLPKAGKPPANRVVQGAGRPQPDSHIDGPGKEPGRHSSVSRKSRAGRGVPRRNARNLRPDRNAPRDAASQGVGNPGVRSGGDPPRSELRRGLPGSGAALRAKGPDVPAPVRR
jgi:hypothetical protein